LRLNHQKNVNIIKLYVGLHLIFIRFKKILLLFFPFHTFEYNLKGQHLSWKDVYLNQKDDVEKIRKKFVYNFNILSDYDDEWDKLQSQVQE